MITYLFYLGIALVIIYIIFYHATGLYYHFRQQGKKKKTPCGLGSETRKMEELCNDLESFQKLDPKEQKMLLDALRKNRKALAEMCNNRAD